MWIGLRSPPMMTLLDMIAFINLHVFCCMTRLVWNFLKVLLMSVILGLNLIENYVDPLVSFTLTLVCDLFYELDETVVDVL